MRWLPLLALACAPSDEPAPADTGASTSPTVACEPFMVPSDDPDDWDVDEDLTYVASLSEPTWFVPEKVPLATGPSDSQPTFLVTDKAWFLAWRSAPTAFASAEAALHVVRSDDRGLTWVHEHTIALDTDVREPQFLWWDGRLSMSFVEGGVAPSVLEPEAIWRAERACDGTWSQALVTEGDRVAWEIKVRGDRAYRTSYSGPHDEGPGQLSVHFDSSDDGGLTWAPVEADPVLTEVGDSEVAFEFDEDGNLWLVTRNEDGDETGQGAKVCFALDDDVTDWDCPVESDAERYDRPELLRHGDDLYLLARRDVGGPFGDDPGLTQYSYRPKRTALYRVERYERSLTFLFDVPGVGDTGFVSARRTGPHTWQLANATSPLDDPDVSWLHAQTSPRGTRIYTAELTFSAE